MLQKNTSNIMTPYEVRKANKAAGLHKYPYKTSYTNFDYTQPRYMNGVIAPMFLCYFAGMLLERITNGMIWYIPMALYGYGIAAILFAVCYLLIIRPSLLSGNMELKYHKNQYRAIPFGIFLWTGFWYAIINIHSIYLHFNKFDAQMFIIIVSTIVSFVILSICMNLTLLQGSELVANMKNKLLSDSYKFSARKFEYKPPEAKQPTGFRHTPQPIEPKYKTQKSASASTSSAPRTNSTTTSTKPASEKKAAPVKEAAPKNDVRGVVKKKLR